MSMLLIEDHYSQLWINCKFECVELTQTSSPCWLIERVSESEWATMRQQFYVTFFI